MRRLMILGLAVLALLALSTAAAAAEQKMFGEAAQQALQEALQKASPQTQQCIACHIRYTPDIVYEWAQSMHAKNVPANAAKLYDEIGAPEWKNKMAAWTQDYQYVVGCYECHGKFADKDRPDVVNHFGFNIVTVVTRKDCAQCHPKENAEISWTWHAMGSLHSPVLPWYKAIAMEAKKMGANPFGDEQAKKLYEEYLPPYLTKTRDKDPIYWEFYKYLAKDIVQYFETGKEGKYIQFVKKATKDAYGYSYVTPYDLDWKKWITPLWPASGGLNTTVVAREILPKLSTPMPGIEVNAVGKFKATVKNIMEHPAFRNGYVYHACLECHGTVVVPYGAETVTVKTADGSQMTVTRMKLWGWPNNGAARVDPDGSIGTCTACHDRHLFSLKQARKPWTCGRCHLGYDHPHIEIYEESAHGNIENAYGEQWNWEALPWKVGVDFNAPTCATCHLSTIAQVDQAGNVKIVVKGTHDLTQRLVWNQMHFFATPKPIIPDKVQEALFLHYNVLKGKMEDVYAAHEKLKAEGAPIQWPVFMGLQFDDKAGQYPEFGKLQFPRMISIKYTDELAKHREAMKQVCKQCHSSQWVDNYFRTADQNMIDYDIVARFAHTLLVIAWQEGLADKKNILDEFPEVMWYYIWHHQGRRWRNGAFMMGPDFAHWFGIVDTVMEALNKMIEWIALKLQVKSLENEIQMLKAAAAGGQMQPALLAKIEQLEKQLKELQLKLAELEAMVPSMKQQLQSVEGGFAQVEEQLTTVQGNVQSLQQEIATLKQLIQEMKAAGMPAEKVAQLEKALAQLEQAAKAAAEKAAAAEQKAAAAEEKAAKAQEKASMSEEKLAKIESKVSGIENMLRELVHKVDMLEKDVGAVSRNTYILAGLALALAVIALGLAAARRQA